MLIQVYIFYFTFQIQLTLRIKIKDNTNFHEKYLYRHVNALNQNKNHMLNFISQQCDKNNVKLNKKNKNIL